MKEVSSAPNKDVNVSGMATTAANSESEQGDQLHQRAVRYSIINPLVTAEHLPDVSITE